MFLYRYYTCCFIEDEIEALEKVKELNLMFRQPLSDREVERDTRSAEKYYAEKKYKYSNDKLIEILDITEREQKEFKTIISTKEKYRRNNERRTPRNENGLTKREQEKQDRINIIKNLLEKGLNKSKIAKELGISRQAISKLCKEI